MWVQSVDKRGNRVSWGRRREGQFDGPPPPASRHISSWEISLSGKSWNWPTELFFVHASPIIDKICLSGTHDQDSNIITWINHAIYPLLSSFNLCLSHLLCLPQYAKFGHWSQCFRLMQSKHDYIKKWSVNEEVKDLTCSNLYTLFI